MKKTTKYCELTLHLQTGAVVRGHYHIGESASAAVRPSDAIRQCEDGLLVLSAVTISEGDADRQIPAALINLATVNLIELPTGWTNPSVGRNPLQSSVAKPIVGLD